MELLLYCMQYLFEMLTVILFIQILFIAVTYVLTLNMILLFDLDQNDGRTWGDWWS